MLFEAINQTKLLSRHSKIIIREYPSGIWMKKYAFEAINPTRLLSRQSTIIFREYPTSILNVNLILGTTVHSITSWVVSQECDI